MLGYTIKEWIAIIGLSALWFSPIVYHEYDMAKKSEIERIRRREREEAHSKKMQKIKEEYKREREERRKKYGF